MKKISDFNSSTEKYPVIYAGSATRPEFVDMPTTLQQQEGVSPMDTLPAQWWNAMWKLATKDINAFRDYVGDSITEINNLLTKFGITLDDADSEQLYDFFHNDYVQNYLNDIFVNKSGDTINGDLHIKGNLSVDGIGEEIISTELKVGSNTITLRNGNPSALGNTELAGVVTNNYDGNNNNNIISIDKNGVARTGDIDIATRILYSNNRTNFFTDEGLTIPATIGTDEKVRDTGNQTSGGVKIYEGITYSNDDTQALATREDNPVDGALMKWNAATKKLVSADIETGVPVDVVEDGNMRAVTSNAVADSLNDIKRYLAWNYKVVSCAGGSQGYIDIPAGYNGNYEYSVYDYKYHISFHGIHITSDGTTSLGSIATNFGSLSNDGITLNNTNIVYIRESTAGDFRIAFRPIPNVIAI